MKCKTTPMFIIYSEWNKQATALFPNNILHCYQPCETFSTISLYTHLSSLKALGLGLMGWSLLLDALRPFKIYCTTPSIISQLVLFL